MIAFSRLPDACQLALFKQLPPEDQLRARSVCRKWDSLIPVAASTRRLLIIIFDEAYSRDADDIEELQSPITMYKPSMRLLKKEDGSLLFPGEEDTIWNTLNYDSLPENICQLIASTFTGVSTLKVILGNVDSKHLEMVITFLQLWRHQLTSFHLIEYIGWATFITEATITRLYAAINSLSSLKRLTLNVDHLPLGDLPVIARLEELNINSRGSDYGEIDYFTIRDRQHLKFARNLQKYGKSNRNLLQVGYSYHDPFNLGNVLLFEYFALLSSHLRQALTQLDVLTICNKNLSTVCNHFQNLMTLEVRYTIDDNGLVSLFEELSKLKQLIYLSLRISIGQLPLPNGHHPLPQLASVKALVLKPYLHTPQHMAALDIGWIFPNLQVIDFRLFGEDNFFGCGYDNNENRFPNANLQLAMECLRQVFHPLKRRFGDKLTILHNLSFNGIYSAEELLATI